MVARRLEYLARELNKPKKLWKLLTSSGGFMFCIAATLLLSDFTPCGVQA